MPYSHKQHLQAFSSRMLKKVSKLLPPATAALLNKSINKWHYLIFITCPDPVLNPSTGVSFSITSTDSFSSYMYCTQLLGRFNFHSSVLFRVNSCFTQYDLDSTHRMGQEKDLRVRSPHCCIRSKEQKLPTSVHSLTVAANLAAKRNF